MISRLSACAAFFAILATATLSFAAASQQQRHDSDRVAAAPAPLQVIELPRVEVTGRRVR
jgi:hypothetical protein